MNFVFLYGPPGVGKLTVGKELAALTGYKLFDNHASIDVIRRVFDFGEEPFWPMVMRLRFDVLGEAARRGVDLISTGAYVSTQDDNDVEELFSAIEKPGGVVLPVHLTCAMDVLEARIPTRPDSKMNSLETARADMAAKDYFTPLPGRESLRIDNTDLAPDEVARRILAHYGLRPSSSA